MGVSKGVFVIRGECNGITHYATDDGVVSMDDPKKYWRPLTRFSSREAGEEYIKQYKKAPDQEFGKLTVELASKELLLQFVDKKTHPSRQNR